MLTAVPTEVKPLGGRTDTSWMSATRKSVPLPGWEQRTTAQDQPDESLAEFAMAPPGAYRVVIVEEDEGATGSRRIEA